ncbi:hypothetical protein B0H14DRAFT_3484459 [Mycena olivaceomarginata]|nr:hypothetical protein B0H14DRAFT_3484459 [Mycena olivaceomarginata]
MWLNMFFRETGSATYWSIVALTSFRNRAGGPGALVYAHRQLALCRGKAGHVDPSHCIRGEGDGAGAEGKLPVVVLTSGSDSNDRERRRTQNSATSRTLSAVHPIPPPSFEETVEALFAAIEQDNMDIQSLKVSKIRKVMARISRQEGEVRLDYERFRQRAKALVNRWVHMLREAEMALQG